MKISYQCDSCIHYPVCKSVNQYNDLCEKLKKTTDNIISSEYFTVTINCIYYKKDERIK